MRRALSAAVFVLAVPAFAAGQAPNGEAIYRQSCAGCHNGTLPRMPSRDALKTLTPEHVETALSSFSMRRQGAALGLAERRAVAEYVTGRPPGSYRAPLEVIPKSAYCTAAPAGDPLAGASWNGFGGDLRNSRFQPAAAGDLADCRAAAEAEVGVWISRRLRVGLAGHRRRQPRICRQPQRRRVRPRLQIRLHRLGF